LDAILKWDCIRKISLALHEWQWNTQCAILICEHRRFPYFIGAWTPCITIATEIRMVIALHGETAISVK
jgi:hypothetical protein